MPNIPKGLKAYAITRNTATNTAEVNMYGEVVEVQPTDWSGELIPGNYIILADFLDDLNELTTYSRIVIHINSGGGDMYAGVSIYNRLRELGAEIVTVCDGLAASAASVIFMAGDVRRVFAGSNVMIHSAASWMGGYYRDHDMEKALNRLRAHTQSMVNIYADRTGKTEEEIHAMVDGTETWFTGGKAVSEGFATELAENPGKSVTLKYSPDRAQLVSGSYAVAARCFHSIPDGVPVMTQAEFDAAQNPDKSSLQGIALLIHNLIDT